MANSNNNADVEGGESSFKNDIHFENVEIKHEVIDIDSFDPTDENTRGTLVEPNEESVLSNDSNCNCSVEDLLLEPSDTRPFSKTVDIIRKGRPTPCLTMPSSGLNNSVPRYFKAMYYEKVEWLTGCSAHRKLYCWPCLLFDKIPGLWNNSGFEDLGNFYKIYKRHENTQSHIVASMQLVAFFSNHCGMVSYDFEDRNTVVKANREALKRVIEAVCVTGASPPCNINTLQLLRLARREHTALSVIPDLHVRVIKAISRALKDSLRETFKEVPFVSLFLDELSEGRIATVLRYTDKKGELRDTFVGFIDGSDLGVAVRSVITEYHLTEKLVAILLGVSKRPETLPVDPRVIILHSPAHGMSYALAFTLYHIKECAAFFHVLQSFEKFLKDPRVEQEIKLRLPNINVAKWCDRPVIALYEEKELILDLVLIVLDKPSFYKSQTYVSALVLQHAFKDLEFSFLLRIFKELLPVTDTLLDMVLSNSPNTKVYSEIIDDYIKVLNWKKDIFADIWDPIEKEDEDPPTAKKPRRVGSSKILTYYGTLYETIVTAVVTQVELRFKALKNLEFAHLLEMTKVDKLSVSERQMTFLRNRGDWFETFRLRNELLVAYAQIDFKGLQCKKLLRHLYNTGLCESLKQVTKLARLCLVLPYASRTKYESCTRLFSRIQKFSSGVSSEPDLLLWASLNLENKLISKLVLFDEFLDEAVDSFAESYPNIQLTLIKPKD